MLDHLNNKVSEITQTLTGEKHLITSLEHQLSSAKKRAEGLEIDLKVYNSAIEDLKDPSSFEEDAKEMVRKLLAKLPPNTTEVQSKIDTDIGQGISPIFHRATIDPLHDASNLKPAEVGSNPIPQTPIHFVVSKKAPGVKEEERSFVPAKATVVSNKKKGNKKNKTAPKFGKKGFGNKTVMPKKDK